MWWFRLGFCEMASYTHLCIYIYIYIYVDQIGLCFGHTRVLVLTRVLRLSWAGSEALVLRSEALLPTSRPDIYIYLLSLTSRRLSSYVKLMDLWCRKIVKPCQDLVLPNCHPIPQSVAYIYIYIYIYAGTRLMRAYIYIYMYCMHIYIYIY